MGSFSPLLLVRIMAHLMNAILDLNLVFRCGHVAHPDSEMKLMSSRVRHLSSNGGFNDQTRRNVRP